ncbi:MAG TPA: hypothetical protein VEC99_00750, partial [Clostridia bacterium]|nr:hypothetical protein [Clostridia bacterium]
MTGIGCVTSVSTGPMADRVQIRPTLTKSARFSYLFMVGLLVAMVFLHLATPLLAALFTYLALDCLQVVKRGRRWVAVGVFLILVTAVTYGAAHFLNQTVRALPEIANKAIPSILETAKKYHVELPFTDYESLREVTLEMAKGQARHLSDFAKVARGASAHALYLVAGCIIAVSLFLNPRFELSRAQAPPRASLYSVYCDEISNRFR